MVKNERKLDDDQMIWPQCIWDNVYMIWRSVRQYYNLKKMGYAQRFTIGVFLIVSAYEIYEYRPQNHHFLVGWISKITDPAVGNEEATSLCQKALAIIISCSGVALMIGYGLISAIISQSLIILLSIFDSTKGTPLNLIYWIILNLAVLTILIVNYRTIDSEDIICPRQKQELEAKQERQ